jgi:pimeloyl-ACP methyl ester carboxylesterase
MSSVEVGGVTIGYRTHGDPAGPPVVLLHGGSSGAATWDRLSAALAATGHRTIAVDLRGHGGSSRTAEYPLSGFRDDIIGLLDALGLDRVALVGHSLGAYTASLIAQQQPERITRLVLEEPPVPIRGRTEAHGLSTARFLLPAVSLLAVRRRCDPRAVVSVVRQLRVPDPGWWQRLAAITAPALLISGGPRSHIAPARIAEAARSIPGAQVTTIPVGHRVHSRDPVRFHAAVVPFLAARPANDPADPAS